MYHLGDTDEPLSMLDNPDDDALLVSDLRPGEDSTDPDDDTEQPTDVGYEQIHFIDGQVIRGPHPDQAVQEQLYRRVESDRAAQTRVIEYLAKIPSHNEHYTVEIAQVHDELATTFGQQTGDVPVYVLPQEEIDRLRTIGGTDYGPKNIGGIYIDGVILINDRPNALYKSKAIIQTYRHEGGHAAAGHEFTYITVQAQQPGGLDYDITRVNPRSFYERPIVPGGFAVTGHFFEEGAADMFRVHQSVETGTAERYREEKIMGDRRIKPTPLIAYVPDNTKRPNISENGEIMAIPWRYAGNEIVGPRIMTFASVGGIAAYGFDLLDEHLPGLCNQIIACRQNPELKQVVDERIASIHPDLPRKLKYLQNSKDTLKGLRMIQQALGITDRPAGRR